MQKSQVRSSSWKDPLEKEMATHSSILAWEMPWTKETGGLQSMGVTEELDMTQQRNNSNNRLLDHPRSQRVDRSSKKLPEKVFISLTSRYYLRLKEMNTGIWGVPSVSAKARGISYAFTLHPLEQRSLMQSMLHIYGF